MVIKELKINNILIKMQTVTIRFNNAPMWHIIGCELLKINKTIINLTKIILLNHQHKNKLSLY